MSNNQNMLRTKHTMANTSAGLNVLSKSLPGTKRFVDWFFYRDKTARMKHPFTFLIVLIPNVHTIFSLTI